MTSHYANQGGGGRRNLEGLSHSIHLELRQIEFVDEDVGTSVVVNSGGSLWSSSCLFANNTAESIIRSEGGTVELSRSEFSGNEVSSDGGIVVLDYESELERDKDNCAGDGDGRDGCGGIVVGGICEPF